MFITVTNNNTSVIIIAIAYHTTTITTISITVITSFIAVAVVTFSLPPLSPSPTSPPLAHYNFGWDISSVLSCTCHHRHQHHHSFGREISSQPMHVSPGCRDRSREYKGQGVPRLTGAKGHASTNFTQNVTPALILTNITPYPLTPASPQPLPGGVYGVGAARAGLQKANVARAAKGDGGCGTHTTQHIHLVWSQRARAHTHSLLHLTNYCFRLF